MASGHSKARESVWQSLVLEKNQEVWTQFNALFSFASLTDPAGNLFMPPIPWVAPHPPKSSKVATGLLESAGRLPHTEYPGEEFFML